MTHTVKGFSIINDAEVDVSLEFPCIFPCLLSLLHWQVCSLPLHHLGSTDYERDTNNNDIDIGIDVKIGLLCDPKFHFQEFILRK